MTSTLDKLKTHFPDQSTKVLAPDVDTNTRGDSDGANSATDSSNSDDNSGES